MDKFDKKKFKTGLLFATAVILIYATIMNFHRVGGFISAVYSVISPLLFGIVLALILGTEGTGLTDETIRCADYTVKIPMFHRVDSLNVAAAGAVAFWETRVRQAD